MSEKTDQRLYPIIGAAIERHPNFLNSFHNEQWANCVHELYYGGNESRTSSIKIALIEQPNIIYSKRFAQAFWFDDDAGITIVTYFPPEEGHPDKQTWKHWQYHQVQMILADDPLEYLESFL